MHMDENLELRIARMEAVNECSNLMSKYQLYHTATDSEGVLNMYALKTPGVRMEHNGNVFDGPDSIRGSLMALAADEEDMVGRIYKHDLVNPVVVAADDGKTVVGTWNSIGLETGVDENGDYASYWHWVAYKVDFIQEDGVSADYTVANA